MAVGNRREGHDRNRQENSSDATQLDAGQYGGDNRQARPSCQTLIAGRTP